MARHRQPCVIFVSHICPFPVVHGNRTRLLALITWLRSIGIHVTYVLQPLDVEEAHGISLLRHAVDKLVVIRSPFERNRMVEVLRRGLGRVAQMLLPADLQKLLRNVWKRRGQTSSTAMKEWGTGDVTGSGHIDLWCWPDTSRAVHRLVRRALPTAVITEYALLSKCLEGLPSSVLKIIDTVEVFFRNRERFEVQGLAAPFVCTAHSEKAALARADVLIGIQKNETEALRELFPGKHVITVGHTYAQAGPWSRNPITGNVLYVGSSNPFNVHGLREFLVHAWPIILARMPDTRLRVVGSCPRIEEVESPGVEYVGRVSDGQLRREYEAAHVVINPQVTGTGLKIKCVEALTAGCPVVMNWAGADGLEEGAGRAFLVSKDWAEFASHVLSILTDATLRRSLETHARQLAERLFSIDATFAELGKALRQRPLEPPTKRA